jgi:hypothetical protein
MPRKFQTEPEAIHPFQISKKLNQKEKKQQEAILSKLKKAELSNYLRKQPNGPGKADIRYIATMLAEMVGNDAIPIELLNYIPLPPYQVGKTKFDQVYDAALSVAFPPYDPDTVQKFQRVCDRQDLNTKIWKIMIPEKFQIANVLIRANSFKEAFALGSDYACRVALRINKRIPTDLTIRVRYMTDKSIRKYLAARRSNKYSKRKKWGFVGHEFSTKEITGAIVYALGHPIHDEYKLASYAEHKDLKNMRRVSGITRLSKIEVESYRNTNPVIAKNGRPYIQSPNSGPNSGSNPGLNLDSGECKIDPGEEHANWEIQRST